MKRLATLMLCTLFLAGAAGSALGAYHHMDEQDAPKFQQAYPDLIGTKLDDCTLCHSGGQYEKKPGKWATEGSCQWCHRTYGYDGSGDIEETLNPFGRDYRDAGRSVAAFAAIEGLDSDNDTYSNLEEIEAIRFPGSSDDDPSKIPAPRIVYTLEELEDMTGHSQFMLMNTSRGGSDGYDFYTTYEGVALETLIETAGMRTGSESITVFCPDGWSQTFDMEPGGDNYWVSGEYPQATYYYDEEAAKENGGWVNYDSPDCQGRENGQIITNPDGLKCMLAWKRDGAYLETGYLDEENKLGGEGPFRVVPPQKTPGPPDQVSTSEDQNVVWPYDEDEDETDHNAGNSPRTSTAIRVEPLPEGTTDVSWNDGAWTYVDESQFVVYGDLRNGTVQGLITDSAGAPVAQARITSDHGGYTALSGDDGTYSLPGMVCGPDTADFRLTASARGYVSKSAEVTVSDQETAVLDFTLSAGTDNATCPVAVAAGSAPGMLELVRAVRDSVLSRTAAGQRYIELYYSCAGEAAAQVFGSATLRREVLQALIVLQPALRQLRAGQPVSISGSARQRIGGLLDTLAEGASPALLKAVATVRADLADGTLEAVLAGGCAD